MLQYLKAESGTQSTLVVKKVSDTRWSARSDATKALSKGYRCFQEALKFISEDGNQKTDTHYEAITILKHLSKLGNCFLGRLPGCHTKEVQSSQQITSMGNTGA